jgi:hypothetical protein
MLAIMFVHKTGGSKSVTAETLPQLYEKAAQLSARWPHSYACSTLPYEATWKGKWWDTSPPGDTKAGWAGSVYESHTLLGLYGSEDL